MKYTRYTALFICLLTYLSIYMSCLAQSSVNGNIMLELHEVTPTMYQTKQTAPSPLTQQIKNPLSYTALAFSQPFLSFGFVVPGESVSRENTLQIQTSQKRGTSVWILQDKPLSAGTASITNTTCDTGSCSPSQAGVWQSPLTYGFGIRCENSESCLSDFSQDHMYRPLTNKTPSLIMKSNKTSYSGTLLYKINIPASQIPLPYANTATYLLIPNL